MTFNCYLIISHSFTENVHIVAKMYELSSAVNICVWEGVTALISDKHITISCRSHTCDGKMLPGCIIYLPSQLISVHFQFHKSTGEKLQVGISEQYNLRSSTCPPDPS